MVSILHTEIILYVKSQEQSTSFYSFILEKQPSLHVPGMTEFELNTQLKLGLMPQEGIAKILGTKVPHPKTGNGIPRCELYFLVTDLVYHYEKIAAFGAHIISPIKNRDWGDRVFYLSDPDGHVIAFAERIEIS
jgi:predicted enzyme related to lactoylglutathione lyase